MRYTVASKLNVLSAGIVEACSDQVAECVVLLVHDEERSIGNA